MKHYLISSLAHFKNCIRVQAIILALATGGLAAQPVPLPATERWAIDAINAASAEAKERVQNRIPATAPWRTLTPQLLSQLIQQPEFAKTSASVANMLIDQAGTWDLLHFDKPSDILASWQRWRPNEPSFQPIPPQWKDLDLDTPTFGFYADATYSDEAGAWMILSRCLPRPVWRVRHIEPMIWALEQGGNWDTAPTFDFNRCIRTQSEAGNFPSASPQDSARGLRSAAILDRKLSAYLLKHGCSGQGPDNCLTLLHALVSLSPRRPDLVPIALSMAPHFQPQLDAALPVPLQTRRGYLGPDEFEAAQRTRRGLMRQLLFLDAWLAILVEQPVASMPPDEPARSLKQLFQLTIELSRLDLIQGGSYFQPRLRNVGDFANPWGRWGRWGRQGKSVGVLPNWHLALDSVGFTAAATPGCELAELLNGSRVKVPEQLLFGFAIGKLTLEGHNCGLLNYEKMAYDYVNGATHPEELATMEPLRRFLGDESHARAHNEIVAALGVKCQWSDDLWGVCNWIGDRANKKLTEAQHRLPLRKSDQFTAKAFFTQKGRPLSADRQTASLLKRVRMLRPKAVPQVAARLAELSQQSDIISIDTLWTHPRHPQVEVHLTVLPATTQQSNQGVARTGKVLLVFDKSQASLVSLPVGWGQYDDGNLAALSDIDGDMHLEAWFVGVVGECDGENEIAGKTCAFDTFHIGGEVFGNELSPYIKGPPPVRRK